MSVTHQQNVPYTHTHAQYISAKIYIDEEKLTFAYMHRKVVIHTPTHIYQHTHIHISLSKYMSIFLNMHSLAQI